MQPRGLPFKKGYSPWNKGKNGVYSDDTLNAMSKSRKGKLGYFKGHKHSEYTLSLMREKGKTRLNKRGPKDKPWSLARRQAQESRNGKPYKRSLSSGGPKNRVKPIVKNGKEYHPLWNDIRKMVYKRDSYLCQECGVHCHNTSRKKIQCHHIDYDITNNDLSNLVTLCASCHAKTNYKRLDWIIRYSEKTKGLSGNA